MIRIKATPLFMSDIVRKGNQHNENCYNTIVFFEWNCTLSNNGQNPTTSEKLSAAAQCERPKLDAVCAAPNEKVTRKKTKHARINTPNKKTQYDPSPEYCVEGHARQVLTVCRGTVL